MDGTKVCTMCKRELPIDSFAWKNKAKGYRRSACRDCLNKQAREKYKKLITPEELLKKIHKRLSSNYRDTFIILKDDFIKYWKNHKDFIKVYGEYEFHKYEDDYTPSIVLQDKDGLPTLDNLIVLPKYKAARYRYLRRLSEDGKKLLCLKCGKYKDKDEFYLKEYDSKIGYTYSSWCKECDINNKKSIDGIIKRIYTTQINNSIKRGYPLPNYTQSWLIRWCNLQPKYHTIYDNWIKSGYKSELAPSIDRIDPNKPYTKDNIQLMTWEENMIKGHTDDKALQEQKKYLDKSVLEYNSKGELKKIWDKASEVCAEYNISINKLRMLSYPERYRNYKGKIFRFKTKNYPRKLNIPKELQEGLVGQYDLDGNLIKVWDNHLIAGRALGIDPWNIRKVLRGERKKTGGYIWKYIQKENNDSE